MPKVTVQNLLTSDIQLQEYSGNYSFSQTILAGQTRTFSVSWGLAERLEAQLNSLQAAGRISWSATQDPASKLETMTTQAATLTYTQATRPAANAVGASATNKVWGINTTSGQAEYSDGTNWHDAEGNLT